MLAVMKGAYPRLTRENWRSGEQPAWSDLLSSAVAGLFRRACSQGGTQGEFLPQNTSARTGRRNAPWWSEIFTGVIRCRPRPDGYWTDAEHEVHPDLRRFAASPRAKGSGPDFAGVPDVDRTDGRRSAPSDVEVSPWHLASAFDCSVPPASPNRRRPML